MPSRLAQPSQSSKTPNKPKAPPDDVFLARVFTEIKKYLSAETCLVFADDDLTLNQQKSEFFKHYHGEGELVSQVDLFIARRGMYADISEPIDTQGGRVFVLPEYLHRLPKKLIYGRNLKAATLMKTYKNSSTPLSGRTGCSYAKEVTREAKKMLSLVNEAVREKIIIKDSVEYGYYSGKNQGDFIDFILFRMYNWKKLHGAAVFRRVFPVSLFFV